MTETKNRKKSRSSFRGTPQDRDIELHVFVDNTDVIPEDQREGYKPKRNRLKPREPEIYSRLMDLGILSTDETGELVDDYGKSIYKRNDRTITPRECAYAIYLGKYLEITKMEDVDYIVYKVLPDKIILWANRKRDKTGEKPYRRRKPEGPKNIIFGIHAVSQFYGDVKQPFLFSDKKIDEYVTDTKLELTNRPESYGVVLTQSQFKVFQGILKGFTDTGYMGENQVKKEKEWQDRGMKITSQKGMDTISKPYQNINKVPVIKITQSELLTLSGFERTQNDKTVLIEAVDTLATKQFCFFWSRLAKTEKGIPVKDPKTGDYKKEEVMEVGTLFRIKYVRDKETRDLKYYEISPSAVILDQVNKSYGGEYFLLVPNNWRDEVRKLTGKRGSSYTYDFLLWLRLQFEHIRRYNSRHKDKRSFTITKAWEEIAGILNMPESMYKANRRRASKIIQDAYNTAIKLGYLIKVEPDGAVDTLYLNEEFYPKPGELK